MLALLCPGQGAQYPGMGREIADRWTSARALFERADEALGMPLSKTLFEGSEETVNRTDVCQPGILTVTAAILAVLEQEGRLRRSDITFAAGLSLGEYTAHYVAGTIAFEDAVRLVRRRGEYMQDDSDRTPSGMAAVMGLELDAIEETCAAVREDGGLCVVANLNSPGQVVVSGENGALADCEARLLARGAKRFVRLPVAGAFHSPVMSRAAERLAADLATTPFADPSIPVISNVTAAPVTTAGEARDTLSRQVIAPVLFERSLRLLLERGVTRMVEPGPGKALRGFVRKIDRDASVDGYDAVTDITG